MGARDMNMDDTAGNTRRVRAHIWYDAAGVILAVGYAPERAGSSDVPRRHATALVREGQYLLDAEVPLDAIADLHTRHRVDVFERALVARGETAG